MIDQLVNDILSVIERHRLENDLTYAETLGCLELIKFDLLTEAMEQQKEAE